MIIYIFFVLICAALGYSVATEENKELGAVLGLVFGPIGVVIAAVMKGKSDE